MKNFQGNPEISVVTPNSAGRIEGPSMIRVCFVSLNQLQIGDVLHLRWQDRLNRCRSPRFVPGSFGCSKEQVLNILRRKSFTTIWIPGRALTVKTCSLVKVDRSIALTQKAGGR